MDKPTMSQKIKEECAVNETFRRGRTLTIVLMTVYGLLRLAEVVVLPPLTGTTVTLVYNSNMVGPVLFFLLVISSGLNGRNKAAGWFCLLTAVGYGAALFISTVQYGISLADLFRYTPVGWYTAVSVAVAVVLGLMMLCNKSVRAYAGRRQQMAKELRDHYAPSVTRDDSAAAAPAAPARPRHHLRNLIISLVVCTALALAGALAMDIVTPPTSFEELEKAQGGFVSLEAGSVDGAYRLKLDGSDLTYTISSIVDFPAEEFLAQQEPGAPLTIFYEDDEWRNILVMSSGEITYMNYDQSRQALIENNYWGWGMLLVAYAILVTICMIVYFNLKKKRRTPNTSL
ncbi:MAG TPA: hypothetical protein DC001_04180 [Clostridiales bacterium]|jgi:hypothetical protein|nr:hypothetical protein [Clostridiales bacterium]